MKLFLFLQHWIFHSNFLLCAYRAVNSIPGLSGRWFQFLGLLGCSNRPCSRENLPADKVPLTAHSPYVTLRQSSVPDPFFDNAIVYSSFQVTGLSTPEQILESLRRYERRSDYCNDAVSALYRMLKDDSMCIKDKSECLELICKVMRRHMSNVDRQIPGR